MLRGDPGKQKCGRSRIRKDLCDRFHIRAQTQRVQATSGPDGGHVLQRNAIKLIPHRYRYRYRVHCH